MTSSEEPLRVVVVVTRFMAGAGGVALRGACALDPARYAVSFVTGGGRIADSARALGFDVEILPDLVANLSPKHDVRAVRVLTEFLREHRPDVVHTHSAKAGGIGRIAARRAGVPLVVHTYHGFPFHEFQRPWTRTVYVATERFLSKRTDIVLTVGSAVGVEAIRRHIVQPAQLHVVPVTVDGNPVLCEPTTRKRARLMLGIPCDATVVGTVGRLDYQKAPEDFIRALQRLRHRDALGVWVGAGPLRPGVGRQVDRAGLRDRVLLLGERADVREILPAFDVFAMSSLYEGLPCAIVEAMMAGVPVVATAVNAVSDVVVPGETGLLVPPRRPDVLGAAIDAVLDDPVAAHTRAVRGRKALGDRFDPQRLGEVLDAVYQSKALPPDSDEDQTHRSRRLASSVAGASQPS
jgi:glycosyltransferase involved in cell wall biosynthesis